MIRVFHIWQGEQVELTPLVKDVKWSGDIMQASRMLEVSLSNTINGKKKAVGIRKGAEVVFRWRDELIFRGIVFRDNINDKGQHSFTAHDTNTYLTRNSDTIRVKNETASAFIKRVCSKFGIPVGTIQDTGYVIKKMIFREKTLWEMFVTVLTETRKQTGRKYILPNINGKLNLFERKTQSTQWVLENGVNILSADYSASIEDMRTIVKVVGETKGKKEIVSTVKNDSLIKVYGQMQHIEQASGEVTQAQIDTLAKQLLKELGTIDDEANVSAIGKIDVYSGKAVYVKESMTRILGGYYVVADTHTFVGNMHTMDLRLSATDDLPVMEYEEEKEDDK